MRRLSDRARLEGMLALRKALDGVRRNQNATPPADEEALRASYTERRDDDDSTWWRRAELTRDENELINKLIVGEERVSSPLSDRDAEETRITPEIHALEPPKV